MDICEHLSRELHVTKTALTESETTEHKLRDKINSLRASNEKLRAALTELQQARRQTEEPSDDVERMP
jgi:septal ring factor EnvC (AmiA/AmiB activator)